MYIFIGIFIFLTGILKRKKITILLLILLLSIISSVRYNVGGDYISYKWIFNTIQSGEVVDIEKGYYIVNKIILNYGGFQNEKKDFFNFTIFVIFSYFKC